MRAGRPTRVALVVEDDPIIRLDVVDALEDRGWTVLETSTGEKAIVLMNEHQIDVVLTDIQLGGKLTGWDVARAARDRWPALPVVYMSALAVVTTELVEASAFCPKPYDPVQVVKMAEQMLAEKTFSPHQ